jgi:hypothetical protein
MRRSSQPGVLPLRPLTVGELLDAAVALLRTRAPLLLGLGIGVAAAEQAVLFPLRRLADVDLRYWPADDRWAAWALLVTVGFATEALIIALLGKPAATTAPQALLGAAAPAPEPGARPVLATATAAVLVAGCCGLAVGTIAGWAVFPLLFVITIPLWFWLYGSMGLSVPAVVIDRLGPLRAIGRSVVLSHRGGRVLFLRPLAYLGWFAVRLAWGLGVLWLIGLVYTSPSTMMDNLLMAVVFLAYNAVAYPVLACLDAVLHLETRMRTEGLDIALQRALHSGANPETSLARA